MVRRRATKKDREEFDKTNPTKALDGLKTVKQKKFVLNKAAGMDNPTAIIAAGYEAKSLKSAGDLATNLMIQPKVRHALTETIERMVPNLQEKVTKVFDSILTEEERTKIVDCPHCQKSFEIKVKVVTAKTADQLKAIDLLSKIYGWNAAQKKAVLTVDLSKKYQLPEE